MNSTQATPDCAVRSGVRIEIFPWLSLCINHQVFTIARVRVECGFRGAVRYDDELTDEARVEREPTPHRFRKTGVACDYAATGCQFPRQWRGQLTARAVVVFALLLHCGQAFHKGRQYDMPHQ